MSCDWKRHSTCPICRSAESPVLCRFSDAGDDDRLCTLKRPARKAGVENVEFLKGEIENIPMPDNSVDVIISNCVINLSGDKDRVPIRSRNLSKSSATGRAECAPATISMWTTGQRCDTRVSNAMNSPLPGARRPRGADVALTLAGPPPTVSHWTGAAMAKAAGISVSSVQPIWRAHGLRPHLVRRFNLSNDPQFAAKLKEIVGLYVDPPDHAIVLSVDEKSQIQALDRTQPGLPMKKGRADTMTHDYKRHGVTTLFAALDVLEGKVIGQCMKRHRHQEFIRFLNVIDAKVPKRKAVHVIVDNYAAHKHPKALEWIENHPRFVFHFTPTSASWLNAVESFFAKLTKKRLKRGVFRSLQELKDAIHRFLDDTNANPKPFTWTKDPNKIIAAVKRGHQMLNSIHSLMIADKGL